MATRSNGPPVALQGENKNPSAWVLRRIWDKVHKKNEWFVGAIVGREGSGKSHTAMRIASELDPSFTAKRVIFDIADLLEVLAESDHEPGDAYVLDEAGVQLGKRTWQERSQILANQALQLARNSNLILILTLPRLGELDSQAQGRLHSFYEIIEKEDGDYVSGKWKWLDPDRADITGQIYRHFPKRYINGETVKYRSLAFKPPVEALVDPYEERKQAFQQQFYRETVDALREEDEEDDGDDEKSPKEIATEIAKDNVADYVSIHSQNNNRYVNTNLILANYDIPKTKAKAVKSLLQKQINLDKLDL